MANEELKRAAAENAAELVKPGMTLGLGTGSTVNLFLEALAKRINAEELDVWGVATSKRTEEAATLASIPLVDINEIDKIDLAIDGADEVDRELNLLKGGGGALTREKIVDYTADQFVVIADESKMREMLGEFPVPVEVIPYAWFRTKQQITEELGATVSLRTTAEGEYFVTDNGNYILDAKFIHIPKPERMEHIINHVPGVVENGIFTKEKVWQVIVGTRDGVMVYP